MSVEQVIQQAVTHHRAGQFHDAEKLYLAILEVDPQHPDANHNLGILEVHGKRLAASLSHFAAALAANPASEQYWLSYIDALIQAGLTDDARQVLALGWQHGLQGEAVEALALRLPVDNPEQPAPEPVTAKRAKPETPAKPVRKANTRRGARPGNAEVDALGVLFNQGRFQEMETAARKLTVRFPKNGPGWKALGAALQQQGRDAEALGAAAKRGGVVA